MKKIERKLVYRSNTLAGLLFEQDGNLFADDEGDADEAAEEDTEEDTGEGDDEGGDEAPAEDEAEAEETEEKLDVDVEEEVKLSKSIDQDLEALLIDFEAAARKSRQIGVDGLEAAEEAIAENSLRLGMLLEQDAATDGFEEQLDIDRFTSEVARLVKNYTTLLDMEKMIVSKAREFILTRYGQEAETMMLDVLNSQHDIVIEEPPSQTSGAQAPPIAVGAGSGAAGGE